MIHIDKHWLSPNNKVSHINCPKNGQRFVQGQPDTIIIHYTAGKDAKSSAKYLSKDNVKASAHVVVARDGSIIQLVPFDTIAWHAGKSEYNGRVGYNKFSIGIEIDNAGILTPSGDEFVSWFGKKYLANDVIKAKHRNEHIEKYWHTYTEDQIEMIKNLCEALIDKYPSIINILGHEEIAPGRKSDPGPAFPLDNLRNRLIQDRDSEAAIHSDTIGYVDVSKLNIRGLPDINSQTVTEPLIENTPVKIIDKYKAWYKVKIETEGWVASEYIALGKKN